MFGLISGRLWSWVEKIANPYPLIRPFLFMMDPEDAHELTLKILGYGLGPQFNGPDDEILKTTVFGIEFPNPVGLAAGLDKQATRIDEFMGFGFGTIEIGTVVPLPQIGNPRPRMFRVANAKALINRFGMNSVGVKVFTEHLAAWQSKTCRTRNPLGINISKNKETTEDVVDYITCLEQVAPYADYVTINISSPNTPGLRDLQGRARLAEVLKRVTETRDKIKPGMPILVKIAPDLTEEQQADIAAVVKDSSVQAMVISNSTLARPSTIPDTVAKEAGGLSGPPLFGPSTRLLSAMYKLVEGKVPLIGCGGISSGEDAYLKIRAGASMVQIYTVLVYEGPLVVQKIKRELAQCLRRDGFLCVADAVGADHKKA